MDKEHGWRHKMAWTGNAELGCMASLADLLLLFQPFIGILYSLVSRHLYQPGQVRRNVD